MQFKNYEKTEGRLFENSCQNSINKWIRFLKFDNYS